MVRRFRTFVIYILTCSLLLVTGCSGSPDLTVGEAKAVLDKLLPVAYEVYSVYLASDVKIESVESDTPEDGCYKVIDERFPDIEQLKKFTEAAFTQEFAQEEFYRFAIDSTEENDFKPKFSMRGEELWMVDGAAGISSNWLTETTKIVSQTKDTAVLSVEKTSFDESEGFHEITIKKVGNEWRLATKII